MLRGHGDPQDRVHDVGTYAAWQNAEAEIVQTLNKMHNLKIMLVSKIIKYVMGYKKQIL